MYINIIQLFFSNDLQLIIFNFISKQTRCAQDHHFHFFFYYYIGTMDLEGEFQNYCTVRVLKTFIHFIIVFFQADF